MYLWRAVDHEGEILDMLVQRRRDSRAALRLKERRRAPGSEATISSKNSGSK
jgi:transposase-like protein